jgi:NAD(P)-dependent dehydrogenase (short-subunit alcohol dehydrogenase family)
MLDLHLAGWDRVMAINLTGTVLGMRALVPLMPADDGAAIVSIGSIAGLTAHHALAYTVSKWGLHGLSEVAALELAPGSRPSGAALPRAPRHRARGGPGRVAPDRSR